MFLRRTGRLSGVTATLGTMLQLKPLLRGDETGHITVFNKVRGRKRAVETLGELYRKRVCSPETQRVYISHGTARRMRSSWLGWSRKLHRPRSSLSASTSLSLALTWVLEC